MDRGNSTGRMVTLTSLREQLAEIEHEQWMAWSKDVAARESLSPERVARWQRYWVPYAELSEEVKEQDRAYADQVLALLGRFDSERQTAA